MRRALAIGVLVGLCFRSAAAAAPLIPARDSVLQHHHHANRDGLYVDPMLTRDRIGRVRRLFRAPVEGPVYAQPLYVAAGRGRPAELLVVTERNHVYAFDPASGRKLWERALDPPLSLAAVRRLGGHCGNIDPVGITGTPVIDLASRTLFFDEMSGPAVAQHLLYALSIDDGRTRPGWPIDVAARVPGFSALSQNQRGALALVAGAVYVPYGAHYGDCGTYHGWVVGVPAGERRPLESWSTAQSGSGIWAPGGIASDGAALYVATGNQDPPPAATAPWADSEAILRLTPKLTFSRRAADYFAPADWRKLDAEDIDLGGSGPVLFDVQGRHLAIALGKNGYAYLLDRDHLGGIGGALASAHVASNEIITAAAAYTTQKGSYVVASARGLGCPGKSGDLLAIAVTASPPGLHVAWCAEAGGRGSPIVSTSDGRSNPVVWVLGAEGDERLHAFDGDTGRPLYREPAGRAERIRRFSTPIVAGGRIYFASDAALYGFDVGQAK